MSLLFTSGKIGSLEVKNRVVRSPVYEALAAEDGSVGEAMIACHTRLARGGAGLSPSKKLSRPCLRGKSRWAGC